MLFVHADHRGKGAGRLLSEFAIQVLDASCTWRCRPPSYRCIMHPDSIVLSVGEAPEIEAFLAERIYEFNAKATGYFDGESLSGTQRDESGVIRAGVCGYTWGGCCYITYLWVADAERGCGLGTALLSAAEDELCDGLGERLQPAV